MLSYSEKSRNILLLQNDNSEGEVLRFQINKHFSRNVNVLVVNSSSDALKKIGNQKFDFILSEQQSIDEGLMPFLHEIMQSELNKQTPITIIEDGTQDEYKTAKNNLHFLSKPINYSKLMKLMAEHLGLTRSEQFNSALIYQSMVDIFNQFCNQAFKMNLQITEPQLKDASTPLAGDIKVLYNLESGGYKSNYLVSLDHMCLDSLRGTLTGGNDVNIDITAKALVNVMMRQLSKLPEKSPIKLHSKKVLNESNAMLNHLNSQKGIQITLSCDNGIIHIYSF